LVRLKDEKSENATTMHTRYGNFKYKVIPFVLVNALTMFQYMMNTILHSLCNQGVVVYLDDILIYTKTMMKHQELVMKVFSIHQKEGLAVTAYKSLFYVKEVEILGDIINVNSIEMSNRKVKAVRSWEMPKELKDVQRFLGFANIYYWFIKNYSEVA
jgi:hypothetical protein